MDTPFSQPEYLTAFLAAIVDSSDDAIVSKTLDGIIRTWNRGAERIFGYSAAEAIGRHITLIIPPARHAEEDYVIGKVGRGEIVDHYETVRVTKDGRLIDISLTVSPVRDATGRIVGASKIARDISERKRLEKERAALLAREQQAREEAEMLNRSKDQFLAVLSHELRTPLNAIYGWARLLHSGSVDPDMHRHAAEVIVRNSRAQLKLVEDLLDVSRIVTGTMRFDAVPVDLHSVVQASVDSVRPMADAKALRVAVRLEAANAVVMGAADRLQQVVANLLTNAIKFSPRDALVEVVLRDAGEAVEVAVCDAGEGIAADLLPHVFDRFRQGDSSSTRAHGGLGIGLALVRHLTELHGGTVQAHSGGPGLGATFVVRLPRADRQVVAPEPERPRRAVSSLRGVRALIVDDDEDSVELARTVLSQAGADVRVSTAPSVTPAAVAAWSPHVMLLDIEMPGEDGYAVLGRLREAGIRAPAMAVSAYGRPEDRRRSLEAGFALHLAKPVSPEDLVTAAARLIRVA